MAIIKDIFEVDQHGLQQNHVTGFRPNSMKQTLFAICLLLLTLFSAGCGGDSSKKTTQNQSNSSKTADGDKSGKSTVPAKENVKPEKVDSTLPFKDLDIATAKKGIDPGRILIDASGKDSNGKELSLSDYKGKVILLDTWASW